MFSNKNKKTHKQTNKNHRNLYLNSEEVIGVEKKGKGVKGMM